MNEPETLLSLITDAAGGVPEPIKKSFLKQFRTCLGGLQPFLRRS